MVLCVYACANFMQNARFKPMHATETKLCRHSVFQMSFRNIQRQKSYRNFLGDLSGLWPSIYFKKFNLSCLTSLTANLEPNNWDIEYCIIHVFSIHVYTI